MDSSRDTEAGNNAEEVVESLGESPEAGEDIPESRQNLGDDNVGDPLYVQKRLKQQKRAHDREMREMQARIADMQAQQQSQPADPGYYGQGANPGNVDQTIQQAVSFALQQRDLEERKAREAQAQAELGKEYENLQRHLDDTSDRYDDFDDVVRGNHAPFTATIRDAALLLPREGAGSAGEVLYKLGKNPDELERISRLNPHRQAAEVVRLSHALIRGTDKSVAASPRPLGTVKANPVSNSVGVTEKTTPAQIRALMKEGKFK